MAQQCALHDFYKTLLELRKSNTALFAADTRNVTAKIITAEYNVFAFTRKNNDDEVLVILKFIICRSFIHLARVNYRQV